MVFVYVDFYTLPFSPCYIYPLFRRLCSHQAIYLLYICVDLFAFSYYTHLFLFMDAQIQIPIPQEKEIDYAQRAQWLRAAVLGANDGLISIASLMMGVGAVKNDVRAMFLAGFAGLVAGACSMAIGEFVSVYSQLDIEVAQMKREKRGQQNGGGGEENGDSEKENLPNPFQAALASALAFSFGAIVPLMAAAFIANRKLRLAMVICAVSLALLVFGAIGAVLGKTPKVKSCARVLIGGWMAMAITYGLTKLVNSAGLEM